MIPKDVTEVVDLLFPPRHWVNLPVTGHGGAACGADADGPMVTTNSRAVTCHDCVGKMHELGISTVESGSAWPYD